jgi:putative transcriptional regulator
MAYLRALVGGCLTAAILTCPLPSAAQIDGPAIFLVAAAKMTDPRFAKSVILVTRHGRSPPLGVIINRPLGLKLGDALSRQYKPPPPGAPSQASPDAPTRPAAGEVPLFFGGPVGSGFLVYLFRSDAAPPSDAIKVAPDIHLGRAASSLDELLSGTRAHSGLRVFTGYAGWAYGQLEKEIARGDWHVQAVDREYLFDKDVELIWPELHRRSTQTTADVPAGPADQARRPPAYGLAYIFPSLIYTNTP